MYVKSKTKNEENLTEVGKLLVQMIPHIKFEEQ